MGIFKHGASREGGPLYKCWMGINRRCNNKNDKSYKNYGGRGIKMCDDWKGNYPAFEKWALSNGWKKGLTIERNDVNGNYEPSNCSWIPKSMQSRNTRVSKHFEYDGKKLTIPEWSRITGITDITIWRRIYKRGWSIEDALTIPPESAISSNKICEQEVMEIFNSKETADVLAAKYKVSKGTIWAIWRGGAWSHLTGKKCKRKITKHDKRTE